MDEEIEKIEKADKQGRSFEAIRTETTSDYFRTFDFDDLMKPYIK